MPVNHRLISSLVTLFVATVCPASGLTFLSTHGDKEHWQYEKPSCAVLSAPPEIYALSGDVAFISATVATTAMPSYRPLFMRTANGGSSWDEVLQPSYGRQIVDVHFNNSSEGWALMAWIVEGPGDLSILKTDNGGVSWKLVSEIPKSHWDGWPVDVYFHDADHGFVEMVYDGQNTEYWELLETFDGGSTWAVASKMPVADHQQQIERDFAASKVRKEDNVGTDGAKWSLEMDFHNYELRIWRASKAEKYMKVVRTIREPFLVNNGIITMGPNTSIYDERCH